MKLLSVLVVIVFFTSGINCINRIIVDVDAGVDDFQALVFLLNAEHEGLVKIEAIICANGNAKIRDVANNVLRLLEIVQRTDIPVYLGSYNSIMPKDKGFKWFGKDGFADLKYDRDVQTKPKKELGLVAMDRLLRKYPKEITIIALGPLTNIGMLLRMFKGVQNRINEVIVMGGNYLGNETEFNFNSDPEAASIVLSQLDVRLLTWQSCSTVTATLEWRFSLNISNPVWNLLERAERKIYANDLEKDPNITYISCDGLVGMLLSDPSVVTGESKHSAQVMLCEGKSRGLAVIDESNTKKNADFIYSVNSKLFKSDFEKHFNNICKNYKCLNIYN